MILVFNILLVITLLIVCRVNYKQGKKIKLLEGTQKKFNNDINSLLRNQSMLSSTIKELYRIIRKYDKRIKLQVRTEA
jgi:hypothetical protein